MSKKTIYAASYNHPNPENSAAKEAIKKLEDRRKAPVTEARKLGHLLREERAATKQLQRRLRELEGEVNRLRGIIARSHR